MIWVNFCKTVWLLGCKEMVRIIAYLKIAKKKKEIDNTKKTSGSDNRPPH